MIKRDKKISVKENSESLTVHNWKCLRCEHNWLPRSGEKPKVCPKCMSAYWNTPRKEERK